MKVLKFGGSSVKSADRIQNVINILKTYHERGDKFTVVFSAFGGVTDMLINMSKAAILGDNSFEPLFEEYKKRHTDVIEVLVTGKNRDAVDAKIKKRFENLHDILTGLNLIKDLTPRTLDYVVSFGERNSAFIIANALDEQGVPAEFLDARKVLRTDDQYGGAKVDLSLIHI